MDLNHETRYHTLMLHGEDGMPVCGVEYSVLCHHGVKGMKWGVRRTPEQLGHKPSGGSAGKAVRAVGDAARGLRTARQARLVNKAMQSNASNRTLRKALPYMTEKDIQDKMSRQRLEQQMVSSNREHFQAMKQSGRSIKKGMDAGAGEAAKAGFGTFLKEASDPMMKAAGKTVGQGLLSGGGNLAIKLAAAKLGIDEKTAKETAEIFKQSMTEEFAAAAATERNKFKSKNTLGEAWEKAKEKAASGDDDKSLSLRDVKDTVKEKAKETKDKAESYANGVENASKAAKKAAKKAAANREAEAYKRGKEEAWRQAANSMRSREQYFYQKAQYDAGIAAGRRAAEEERRRRATSG